MEDSTQCRERVAARLWRECLCHTNAPFQRGAEFGGYLLDFYCPTAKLAVEVRDGNERDNFRRNEYLRRLGVELLHFSPKDVEQMPAGVYGVIESALEKRIAG